VGGIVGDCRQPLDLCDQPPVKQWMSASWPHAIFFAAFGELDIDIKWRGGSINQVARSRITGEVPVNVDPRCIHPMAGDFLIVFAAITKMDLGWPPTCPFKQRFPETGKSDLHEERGF
jgi:GDP-D-mannose dehydratase